MLTISVHHPEIRTFIHIKEVLKEVKGGELAVSLFYTKSTPYANELSKEFFGKDGNTTSL
jgi:hypothetical protein